MIDSNATVNGSTVWVSAGAEYNNDEEIWIGQASFETIVEDFVRNTFFGIDFHWWSFSRNSDQNSTRKVSHDFFCLFKTVPCYVSSSQCCQLFRTLGHSEVSDSRDFFHSIDRWSILWMVSFDRYSSNYLNKYLKGCSRNSPLKLWWFNNFWKTQNLIFTTIISNVSNGCYRQRTKPFYFKDNETTVYQLRTIILETIVQFNRKYNPAKGYCTKMFNNLTIATCAQLLWISAIFKQLYTW